MLQPPTDALCDVRRVFVSILVFACLLNSTLLNRMTFSNNRLFSPRAKNCKGKSYFLAESRLQSSLKMEANCACIFWKRWR